MIDGHVLASADDVEFILFIYELEQVFVISHFDDLFVYTRKYKPPPKTRYAPILQQRQNLRDPHLFIIQTLHIHKLPCFGPPVLNLQIERKRLYNVPVPRIPLHVPLEDVYIQP